MRLVTATLLLLTLIPLVSSAVTIHVPGDVPILHEAVEMATYGDTVLVAPGRYADYVGYLVDGVVLTSEGGPDVTTIDGEGWNILTMIFDAGPETQMSGFTIHHGGEAIGCWRSAPLISNNVFREIAGVYLTGSAARIEHNLFWGSGGVGVEINQDPEDQSVISHNTFVEAFVGVAISGYSLSTVVSHNIICNCQSGIACFGGGCRPHPIVECNDVFGSTQYDWWGIEDLTGIDGNISADPMFCDPDNGDFTLDSNSPCTPANNPECGLIGLYPVGCGATATTPSSWGLVKSLFTMPGD